MMGQCSTRLSTRTRLSLWLLLEFIRATSLFWYPPNKPRDAQAQHPATEDSLSNTSPYPICTAEQMDNAEVFDRVLAAGPQSIGDGHALYHLHGAGCPSNQSYMDAPG